MDKILHMVEEGDETAFNVDELIFEEVIDEERSMIRAEPSLDPAQGNTYN